VAKALKNLQPDDITELRHFHEEELSAEDLVEQETLTILPGEAEEGEACISRLLDNSEAAEHAEDV
jgi:hypothetical protein